MTESTETPKHQPSPESGVDAFGEFIAFRRFAMPLLVQLVF
jgi:hypothetical protein